MIQQKAINHHKRMFEQKMEEGASAITYQTMTPELDPTLLGASIILKGIPDFTLVPPGSRLQNAHGATLVVDIENGPCNLPAREIEADAPGHGKAFKPAAQGKRGVTAWVEREGPLAVGDRSFREKSAQRLDKHRADSGTVLLVSHNLSEIRRSCDRVIWLQDGLIVADGPTDEVLASYEAS